MHDSFAGREHIGCGTLKEAPASGELCTPPERVLFIVDHRCVEVRDPARGAREARESEDHAGEVDGGVLMWPLGRNGKSRRIAVNGRVMVNDAQLAARAAVDTDVTEIEHPFDT